MLAHAFFKLKRILTALYNCFAILYPMHLIMIVTTLLPNTEYTVRIRGALMRPFFRKCGRNFKLASGVIINHPTNIEIGDNVYIGHNSWLSGTGGIKIGNDVQFGPMCVIVSGKHVFENGRLTDKAQVSCVSIGSNTWLASHVVVTDGVRIGSGVLVAAGAVVNKNVSDYTVVGGVPAKYLKNNN